jgi:hypothetical protein
MPTRNTSALETASIRDFRATSLRQSAAVLGLASEQGIFAAKFATKAGKNRDTK